MLQMYVWYLYDFSMIFLFVDGNYYEWKLHDMLVSVVIVYIMF
jgi:hypothetical protein